MTNVKTIMKIIKDIAKVQQEKEAQVKVHKLEDVVTKEKEKAKQQDEVNSKIMDDKAEINVLKVHSKSEITMKKEKDCGGSNSESEEKKEAEMQ